MSNFYKINPLVMVGLPTLEERPISWEWLEHFMGLAFPLGSSVARARIAGRYVDEARNAIVEQALEINADYVLFISDDVFAPARTFEMLWRHKKKIVTGVYWTKTYPSFPYLWNGLLRGPHLDWTFGQFFKVDWAGCDCLLVHTDVFRKIDKPWFSRNWAWTEGTQPAYLATEDVYFYTKAREAGFDLWCDSAVQCEHQDRSTGTKFGLTEDMPQNVQRMDWKCYKSGEKIADIGCGKYSPHFGDNVTVVRIDGDLKCKPDILCDIRKIPHEAELYDVVHARHVLEHFPVEETKALLSEWARVLKQGGELVVSVPNLAFAAKQILMADADANYDATYAFWQLYGRHETHEPEEYHKCGYTQHGLKRIMSQVECLGEIEISFYGNHEESLLARAKKVKSSGPYAIKPVWEKIGERENGAAKTEEMEPLLVADSQLDLAADDGAAPFVHLKYPEPLTPFVSVKD